MSDRRDEKLLEPDPRVQAILGLILRLAEGDLEARSELPGTQDELDAILLGLNMLAEEIQERDESLRQAEHELAVYAQRLERSEASYRIVAAHADGLVVVDEDDVIGFCNDAAVQILGFPYVGARWPAGIPLPATGQHGEHRLKGAEGQQLVVETRVVRIRWEDRSARLISVRDVTENRALEADLLAAQRMSLVARLAGGVAHDFNNLLATILGNLELIDMVSSLAEAKLPLERIRESAERAAKLTARLLAVGRRRVGTAKRVDLQQTIEEMRALLDQIVGSVAELEIDHAGAGLTVQADPIQLEQIVLNLVTNARDAVSTGGHISLRTFHVPRDEPLPCRCGRPRGPGPMALLEVRDDGEGITSEHQEQIFEPFFSTRDDGIGTGLGLSTVKGIVERAGGHVCVESGGDGGATFRVFLPIVAGEPVKGAATGAPARQAISSPQAHLLLIVDDEPSVREVLVEQFRALGYRVLEASSAVEALRLVDAHAERVELLLTDVVMPGMDGWELSEELKRSQPQLRTLFMSGYGEAALSRHLGEGEHLEVLAKPFRLAEVQARVQRLLDSP